MSKSLLFRFVLRPALAVVVATTATLARPVASAAQVASADTASSCPDGEQLYRAGDFTGAQIALEQCLAEGTEAVDVLLPLAVMAVRADRPLDGMEYAGRAVEIAPDDAEARYWYGRALLRGDRAVEARQQWEAGLQRNMSHKGILEGLARLALQANETSQAYQLLDQLQRQGLDEPWLHRLLADITASRGMWGPALQHLDAALAREPGSAQDYLSASELSILAGHKERAVGFCRRAAVLEPGAASFGGLGEAFFATEQLDSALVYLRRAVMIGGASTRFRFNLANALEVAGMLEEADIHFRAFLREEPEDPVGHFNFAIHLDKLGRADEALTHVNRAVELDPDMLTARVVQAQMLEQLGRWDEALAAVEALRTRDTTNAAELSLWSSRLTGARDVAEAARSVGKIHLLHLVLGNTDVLGLVTEELATGADFSSVAVRYSNGPGAAKGGDIGWINPEEMVEPLRGAILKLGLNETSPPIESKGLYHLFRRVP